MTISEAARISGLSSKTIRYYEDIGLVTPAERADNGYRQYRERAVEELCFLARARAVGFNLEECRQLLDLQRDEQRQSQHAQGLVLEKCRDIEQRIARLREMQAYLQHLATRCRGDEGPDCAILDELSSGGEVEA
jgi:Cu(I)-responsive transcriptional regulator